MLEDADHALLVKLIGEFKFAIAHPELLAIIDDLLNAGEPPPALIPVAPGKANGAAHAEKEAHT